MSTARGPTFSSPWATVLATAGVAIGLGNVWRFPYMMGSNGGAAFLLFYLVIVLAFGLPALMAELALGRATGRGPLGALARARLPGARFFGPLLVLTVVMGASYYGVVLAFVLGEAVALAAAIATIDVPHAWQSGSGFGLRLGFVAATVLLGGAIIRLGVRRGIERASTFGLPLFFIMFVVLIARTLTLDGAVPGLAAFLVPRPEQFTASAGLAAMGQAFFSLGLGGTFMVVYGRYLRPDVSLPRAALGTVGADVAAALMAGAIVVPAVVAFDLDLAAGPTLLFGVMGEVFGAMPAGPVFGAMFYLSVFLVGMLSLVAAYEVLVAAAETRLGWTRRRTIGVVVLVEIVLSVPPLVIGPYIEISDLLWGTTMQPIGSALAIVALAWCIGRGRALEELRRGSSLPGGRFLLIWLKYILPAGIAVMLVSGWLDFAT